MQKSSSSVSHSIPFEYQLWGHLPSRWLKNLCTDFSFAAATNQHLYQLSQARDFPHLILSGLSGSGKKVRLQAFLCALFQTQDLTLKSSLLPFSSIPSRTKIKKKNRIQILNFTPRNQKGKLSKPKAKAKAKAKTKAKGKGKGTKENLNLLSEVPNETFRPLLKQGIEAEEEFETFETFETSAKEEKKTKMEYIEILESDYHVEVNLASWKGRQQEIVLTQIIKTLIETLNVKTLLMDSSSSSSSSLEQKKIGKYKILVLYHSEQMTEQTQECLLHLVEQNIPSLRVIFVTNNVERFIRALRSRSFVIRVPSPKLDEIVTILKQLTEKIQEYAKTLSLPLLFPNLHFSKDLLETIAIASNGNLHEAIETLRKTARFPENQNGAITTLSDSIFRSHCYQIVSFLLDPKSEFLHILKCIYLVQEILSRGHPLSDFIFQLVESFCDMLLHSNEAHTHIKKTEKHKKIDLQVQMKQTQIRSQIQYILRCTLRFLKDLHLVPMHHSIPLEYFFWFLGRIMQKIGMNSINPLHHNK